MDLISFCLHNIKRFEHITYNCKNALSIINKHHKDVKIPTNH